jgi:uncharacterized protein YigE (DUF2233 family)
MRSVRLASLIVAAWLAVGAVPVWSAQPDAAAGPCSPITDADVRYTVCTIDLARYDVRLFWKGPDGLPYASFGRLKDAPAGRNLAMAMNAGMYDPDLSPVGLYVEDGRKFKDANTANGPGNIHLKPNGVFYVAGSRAGVMETGAYLRARPRATLATQSGPMLVIGGKLHPRFSDEGPSRKLRNGVGVRDGNVVVFAISEGPVSFGAFARLFRDRLSCRDALFLDGSVSSLYAPEMGRQDFGRPMGPIVGAVPKTVASGRRPAQ